MTTQKVTTENLVERFKLIHGDKFCYDLVSYVNAKTPVKIICKTHGVFEQKPYSHLNGSGCLDCKRTTIGQLKRKSQQHFIEEATALHSGKFDYSKVVYKNNRVKVIIICPEHGEYFQSPSIHLKTNGCPKCTAERLGKERRTTREDLIDKLNKIHENKYDYSETIFKTIRDDIVINCKIHGKFIQLTKNHLSGSGCPACNSTGFVSNKPANFYIATNGFLTKVGITNKHPTLRLKDVSNSAKSNFELIEYFSFENGRDALSLETYMLQKLNSSYEVCNTYFDGSKECFHDVPYQFIQQNVGKFLLTI